MKPHLHARNSARRHGGQPSDYQDIHDFIDSSKAASADGRHRSVLHHAFGCFVVERGAPPRCRAGSIRAPQNWMYGNRRKTEIRKATDRGAKAD